MQWVSVDEILYYGSMPAIVKFGQSLAPRRGQLTRATIKSFVVSVWACCSTATTARPFITGSSRESCYLQTYLGFQLLIFGFVLSATVTFLLSPPDLCDFLSLLLKINTTIIILPHIVYFWCSYNINNFVKFVSIYLLTSYLNIFHNILCWLQHWWNG